MDFLTSVLRCTGRKFHRTGVPLNSLNTSVSDNASNWLKEEGYITATVTQHTETNVSYIIHKGRRSRKPLAVTFKN
jgi:hypothetical protein